MNSEQRLRMIIGIVAVAAVGIGGFAFTRTSPATTQARAEYNPVIRPADFVEHVDNRHFPLTPGTTFVSRGTKNGETDTMVVTNETRTVMGVKTTVV
ncbi:MAG: hypothetical protein E6H03_11990, partial [Bacillati bacterium ANGP1]